jgi:carbonic anhydrase
MGAYSWLCLARNFKFIRAIKGGFIVIFNNKTRVSALLVVVAAFAAGCAGAPAIPAPPPAQAPAHSEPAAKAESHTGPHWSYAGDTGPAQWGELNAEYAACAGGKQQSPINLQGQKDEDLTNIVFNYKPTEVEILNNGHTVEVEYAPGSTIEVNGKTYELKQFHFHSPSEHLLNGKVYAVEMHLVHKAADGSVAVVGVFMDEGAENAAFKPVWDHLPAKEQPATDAGVEINAANLLPAEQMTFRYAGSLTTPPCTEGVNWFVMAAPVTVSKTQVDAFQKIFNGNARPVQLLNDRALVEDTTP